MAIKRDYTVLLLALIVIGFVLIKIPHLFLPHYWDEAWAYSPAVQYMYENHLSLIPGSIPTGISRGHPLLFYFLSSLWMRIFGPSLLAKHAFAFVVSLLYLFSIYHIVRKLFSSRAALMAAVFTSCQALFLAQSSMLLPEVLLSLLTIWSLYFYLKNRLPWFALSASLLILTKETGIFLLILVFIWEFFSGRFPGDLKSAVIKKAKRLLQILIPFLVFALNLIVQKRFCGWYLFPEHINLVTSLRQGIKELGSQEYFLQFYGQIYLVIALSAAFIIQLFRKERIPEGERNSLRLIFAFMMFYLISLTFLPFTPRYLMCIHIMLVILTVFYLDFITRKMFLVPVFITLVLAGNLLYLALTLRSNGDYNMGYIDALWLQKKAVNYLEEKKLYDQKIYCGFIMQQNMTQKAAGFIENRPFTHLVSSPDDNPEYLLLTSTEPEPNYLRIKYSKSDSLICHWERNYMWMEIYIRKKI